MHLVGPPYMDPKLHSDEKLQERYEDGGQEELSDAETAIEEQQLLNKLDRRILPITCLLYLFACPFQRCPKNMRVTKSSYQTLTAQI